MSLTEKEILDTPVALKQTLSYFAEKEGELKTFFEHHKQKKFTFFGCGSSFMLTKGTATLFQTLPDTAAIAIPAGDYIVNPLFWREAVRGSIIVTLSRSGRTTEIIRAVKDIKDTLGCPVLSISMKGENDLSPMSDLDLILDWCYDRSVCQTRTVTNLYAATLLLASAYSGDQDFRSAVQDAAVSNADFMERHRPILQRVAAMDWDNVVVLADGPACGIAEEGALAFTEISMLTGRYFHLLDYRHGPIVVSGEKTLTLMLLSPTDRMLQGAVVRDVIAHGGPVVTVSQESGDPYGSAAHVRIEGIGSFAAWGIPFIYLAQMLALLKAEELGVNPDAPQGLDAYITL